MAVIDALKKSQAQEGDTVRRRGRVLVQTEPREGLLEQEGNCVMSGGGGGTCQERESARMLADLGRSLVS